MNKYLRLAGRFVSPMAAKLAPGRWKRFHELRYWKSRTKAEGALSNDHYQHFYTTHFGLDPDNYAGKVILDIGCGPRGSLEWATMAKRAIGIDPLANEYLKLGAVQHRMEYIAAPCEHIPLGTNACDAVFSFNSLDHVEDVDQTIREIKRITRPGGLFLLLVEVNHPPTACEPHNLSAQGLIDSLTPEFVCHNLKLYKPITGIYDSIHADIPLPIDTQEPAYLSAKFVRS